MMSINDRDRTEVDRAVLLRSGNGGARHHGNEAHRTLFQRTKQFLPCTAECASQTEQNPERGTDSACFELLKVSCANIQLLRHELLREVGPLPETSDIATKGNELVFWEWLHARISRILSEGHPAGHVKQ